VIVSPALQWSGVPPNAKSLALIVDDPDAPDPKAPKATYVHWVLYNIPAAPWDCRRDRGQRPAGRDAGRDQRLEARRLRRAVSAHRAAPVLLQAVCARRRAPDLGPATKPELEAAMKGHVLAEATLMGTYEKEQGTS
jgi:phosphatidylethanolamine-binding protein (PEBP) family uncharacterized protein